MSREDARFHLAWLMWNYQQGYVTAEDRESSMGNWLLHDPSTLCEEDAIEREQLLAMADEVLAEIEPIPAPLPEPILVPHFVDERHALYTGTIIGKAMRNGVDVRPVVDEDGNYKPRIYIEQLGIEVIVPPPADDWTLEVGL